MFCFLDLCTHACRNRHRHTQTHTHSAWHSIRHSITKEMKGPETFSPSIPGAPGNPSSPWKGTDSKVGLWCPGPWRDLWPGCPLWPAHWPRVGSLRLGLQEEAHCVPSSASSTSSALWAGAAMAVVGGSWGSRPQSPGMMAGTRSCLILKSWAPSPEPSGQVWTIHTGHRNGSVIYRTL